jgi:hypothetical protein
MIKKVLGILAITAIMFSCGNKEQKKEEACCNKEKATVTVDKVMEDMASYVDKNIVIVGTVNHVCSHGGKRMFIMGENPDVAIKITPSEEIGVFEKELEGSHVMVTGVVKELRIDEAYVANLENDDAESEAMHDHSGGTHEETEEAAKEKQHQLDAMREKIAQSETGYYSQFWIEASKFEVKECEHEHVEGEEHNHDHAEAESEEHEHDHAEGEEHTH